MNRLTIGFVIYCFIFLFSGLPCVYAKSFIVKISPQKMEKYNISEILHSKAKKVNISSLSKKRGLLKVKANDFYDLYSQLHSIQINHKDIIYIEPDYKRHILSLPDDTYFPSQWGLEVIGFNDVWGTVSEKEGVIVAVLDTGIDIEHPDLKAKLSVNNEEDWIEGNPSYNGLDDDGDGYIDNYYGVNVINGQGNPIDDHGHGTEVSGVIGAVCNNAIGICGISQKALIMPFKIMDNQGEGPVSDEIEAINHLIEYKKRTGKPVVINASYGGYDFSQAERDILELAGQEGIIVIAAAGNDHSDNDVNPLYPASYDLPNIVSVSAIGSDMQLSYFSNWGKNSVDLSAPGKDIFTTKKDGAYGSVSGTSFSAPFVSGATAVLLSFCPEMGLKVNDYILEGVSPQMNLTDLSITGGILNLSDSINLLSNDKSIWQMDLKKGWNLISFPISPCFCGDKTFEQGKEAIKSLWSYKDNQWRAYFLHEPEFSDFQCIKAGEGYWIKLEEDAKVTVSGILVDSWPEINTGWNLIGFPLSEKLSVEEVIGQHYQSVSIESIWGYENGQWQAYFQSIPELSDLEFLKPGMGYWIKIID